MFTGQIIGYVGADARQNKNGKGFNFHVSTKYKNTNNEEQTLWVCCFVNYECKVSEYLKKGTQVYVCGDVYADVFQKRRWLPYPIRQPERITYRIAGQS